MEFLPRFPKHVAALLTLAVTLSALAAHAERFFQTEVDPDLNDTFRVARFRLCLPATNAPVRGILIPAPGTDGNGLGLADDPEWQAWAARLNHALLGTHFEGKGNDRFYDTPEYGSGRALVAALDTFAQRANRPELRAVPWIVIGFSMGGQLGFGLACWQPERTRAFVAVKGGYYFSRPQPGTWSVPALLICGETDTDYRVANLKTLFERGRSNSAPWCFAMEPGADHTTGASPQLFVPFVEAVLTGATNAESPNTTWGLPDKGTLMSGSSSAQTLAWLPNAETATVWQRFVRGACGTNDLGLSLTDYPEWTPDALRFEPASLDFGAVPNTAASATQRTRCAGPAGWDRFEAWSSDPSLVLTVLPRTNDVASVEVQWNTPQTLGPWRAKVFGRFFRGPDRVVGRAEARVTGVVQGPVDVKPRALLLLGAHAGDSNPVAALSVSATSVIEWVTATLEPPHSGRVRFVDRSSNRFDLAVEIISQPSLRAHPRLVIQAMTDRPWEWNIPILTGKSGDRQPFHPDPSDPP